jgi:crotonobetainyl-CoA:carnitine CoA-transferase CaiB-like acyl-CoA transferase
VSASSIDAKLHVLDFSRYLPASLAARLLGLLGASIIKVEPLAGAVMRHSDAIFHDGG